MALSLKVAREMKQKSAERAIFMQAVHILENTPTTRHQWMAAKSVANQWEALVKKMELQELQDTMAKMGFNLIFS